MSEGVKLWCFLLLLPFFAAVAHDLYASFYAPERERARLEAYEIDPASYQSSDLGYLLVKYVPQPFEAVREAVGPDLWKTWVDPVLRLYTFVVALIPATLFFTWLLISRIFDVWPFVDRGTRATRTAAPKADRLDKISQRGNEKAKFKYNRR